MRLFLLPLLLLAACGVVGPSEETAPCENGQAIFEGPGPVLYAYEEYDGGTRSCPDWGATEDQITVLCGGETVVISR